MKISVIQTNPQTDRAANIARAEELMLEAIKNDHPDLLVLPEYFDYYGGTLADKLKSAEPAPGGSAYEAMRAFAAKHKVFVHVGSLIEKIDGEDRIYNSTVVFNRKGEEVARYRKIHMFDIVAPDGQAYKESASVKPGEDVVVYDLDGFKVGCTICYDIRFAELFLSLAKQKCDIIVLPAAFTLQTGKDHWEVLLRARAIETQTYIAASAQCGAHVSNGEKRHCYGHSMIIDPWGHVIARASDGEGYASARIDRNQIGRVRAAIPMAQHRRLACV